MMLQRKYRKTTAIAIILLILTATHLFAAGTIRSVIEFDGADETSHDLSAFGSVYQGSVTFSHGNHAADYNVTCGRCHHDDSGEPLADLSPGEEINSCTDCHDQEGLLRGKAMADASGEDILAHYPNAMHQMCIGCHKTQNNRTHFMKAPEACRGCHAKIGG